MRKNKRVIVDKPGCLFYKVKRLIVGQEGVISILLLLILPVMILGSVFTYRLLLVHANENKAHKIAFACSEAYLSRNNAYLFDNFGMIATLDSESLEKSVQFYFEQNQLIENAQDVNVNVTFKTLNSTAIFKEASIDAATIVVAHELTSYSIGLLNQLEIADKIRMFSKTIQNWERNLSEQLDQSGATEIIKNLASCEDVITGKEDVTTLLKYLEEKHQMFYSNLTALNKQVKEFSTSEKQIDVSISDFINTKTKEWNSVEATFLEKYNLYVSFASELVGQLESIETDQIKLNEILESIKALESLKASDETALMVETLQNESKIYSARVTEGLNRVKKMSEMLNVAESIERPTVIDMLTNIAYEIESLMSGIEIGDDQLVLKDAYDLTPNDDSDEDISFSEKILLNEYYLAVFSSYDVHCPRKIGYRSRLIEKRLIKGEVEYLISGEPIEKKSISNTRIKLFGIREAANMVTLISDSEKLKQISNATIALPQPWRTIAFGASVATWCSVESYSDVNRLMKGEGFYFFKSKEQWATDFDTLLSGGWRTSVSDSKSESSDVLDAKMYYLDYLRVLLLIQSETETINRAMTLIACELDNISDGKNKLGNFSLGHKVEVIWNNELSLDHKKTELRFNNEY